jgi:hypothetical protein
VLQAYIDEPGNLIATEEFEPNREPWKFAQVLPFPPSRAARAPARERRPEIKSRGRPTRSSVGRSIG